MKEEINEFLFNISKGAMEKVECKFWSDIIGFYVNTSIDHKNTILTQMSDVLYKLLKEEKKINRELRSKLFMPSPDIGN